MTNLFGTDGIAEAMRGSGYQFKMSGNRQWNLKLGSGRKFKASAHHEGDWLRLASARPKLRRGKIAKSVNDLLDGNRTLVGECKLALASATETLLCVDVPVDEQMDCRSQVDSACESLIAAHARLTQSSRSEKPIDSEKDSAEQADQVGSELAQLCEEAGWASAPRPAGQVAIELETRGHYGLAHLARSSAGYRLWLDLEIDQDLSEVSRYAIAVLLLTAAHTVRMVRPTSETEGAQVSYCWEVCWTRTPSGYELNQALSAITIALGLTGRETQVLSEERLAKKFLAIRDWHL